MLYIGFFLSNLLLGAVIVQLMSIIFDYKPRISSPLIILCLILNSVASMVVLTPSDLFSFEARLLIIALCYLVKIAAYQIIFMQIKLKIAYVCILSYITNTFYELMLSPFFNNTILLSIAAFIIETAFTLLIITVIIKKNYKELVVNSLRIIPKRLYAIIMVFLYVFTPFIFLSSNSGRNALFQKVANILTMMMIVSVVLIIYWLVSIVVREQTQKNISRLLSMQLENQIEYYERINELYTQIRSFNHDFKNHLLCLRSFINENETDKAVDYIDDIEKTVTSKKMNFNTGNIIADIILSNKNNDAKSCNAQIVFEGVVPASGITNADLCVVIANALDNAIEACAKDKSNDEKIISVDSVFRQGYFIFRVINPVFEHVEIKDKYNIKTSKTDKLHHGFGIANIIGISEKYNGGVHISSDDSRFILEATMLIKN